MKSREEELYEAEKGRPPARLPEDHPHAWQWEYRGTKTDREDLLERLGDVPQPAPEQEELPYEQEG